MIEGLIERPPPDPDLCVRFLGDQPYGHIIWSCPACGFSAYSEDFVQGNFPEKLPPGGVDLIKPKKGIGLEITERYLNAFAYYSAQERDSIFLGMLLQRGAWAHRLAVVTFPAPEKTSIWTSVIATPGHLGLPEWILYEKAFRRIAETTERADLLLLRIEWMRRAGRALEAKALLSDHRGRFQGSLGDAAELILELADAELALMGRAEKQFLETARNGTLEPQPRSAYMFLVGELNRRLGNYSKARRWYAYVVEAEATSDEVWFWTWGQLRLMHHPEQHPLLLEK